MIFLLPLLFAPIACGLLLFIRSQPAPLGTEKIVVDLRRQLLLPSVIAGGLPLLLFALFSWKEAGFLLAVAPFVILIVAFGIAVLLVPGTRLLRRLQLLPLSSLVCLVSIGAIGGGVLLALMTVLSRSLTMILFSAACGAWTALVWAVVNRRRLVAWSLPPAGQGLDISADPWQGR